MRHIIMGFFWQGEEIRVYLYKFVGEIEIENDGKFQGCITDEYGGANIKGQIQDAVLEFTKKYWPESRGGSEHTILYRLSSQNNDAKKIFHNGWRGSYKILSGDENDHGEASCMIFPRS